MNSRQLYMLILIFIIPFGMYADRINRDTLTVTIFNQASNYNHSDINDVHLGSDSYIYLGLWKQSLLRVNGDGYKYYMKDEGGRSTFTVSSIYEDSGGQMWVGDDVGFQKFNKVTGDFTSCAVSSLESEYQYERQVVAMHEIDDSLMLLGTLAGIHVYDKVNDTIVKFHIDGEYKVDGASTTNNIKKFCTGNDANIVYYTSRSGLGKVDIRDFSVTRVRSKYDEELGHVWLMKDIVFVNNKFYIKYKNTKILSYDSRTNEWKMIYNRKLPKYLGNPAPTDSFPIYLRNFQKLDERYFLTTSRELGPMLFDSSIDSFRQLFIADKTFEPISEFENPDWDFHRFFTDSYWALIDKNGYLWSSNGREMIIRTNEPLVIKDTSIIYGEIHLEEILINGRPVKNNQLFEDLYFDMRDRNLGFSYSLANPSVEKDLYYRYRLKNSQPWEKAIDKVARFTNLSGGNHTLYLEALVNDKVVSERKIKFHIGKEWYEKWQNLLLLFVMLATLLFFFFKYYINKKNETVNLKAKIAEVEMSALRAQMNPHFLFNSLNSINQYIMTESPQKASRYLTKFSMLMRSILNNSKKELIPLKDEIASLTLYTEMEQLRYNHSFDFNVVLKQDIDIEKTMLPPLIIQPYVENAIVHGLALLKDRKGEITINITSIGEMLLITIMDNGIGRSASKKIQEGKRIKKESYGMSITSDRIELATHVYKMSGNVEIVDEYDTDRNPIGTSVNIKLPLVIKSNTE